MMRLSNIFLAFVISKLSHASPVDLQAILHPQETSTSTSTRLHGRFLHITDFHPDPFYQIHSSTEEGIACHRKYGPAGTYGAETSDCDTPYSLVNATFTWIAENIRDTVDFVIWTGDSARHDSDEKMPRDESQVISTNDFIAGKFAEIFGNGEPETGSPADMRIPVVPTFGNNDILPHNILAAGPNKWLKKYTEIWKKFIPEEQRHGFERGGWFYVEVIPQSLAVFSLNTMYLFDHNSAVDGCAARSEPGYELMEWLHAQLQIMRERGMKVILMGHVPPARTGSKQLWDETCWQKYTLWLRQYRDIIVGGLYGHMNIDHFMLHDTKDVDLVSIEGQQASTRDHLDDELTVNSAADYLEELRQNWSKLPSPEPTDSLKEDNKSKKSKKDKGLKKIGGPWGERFVLTHVNPSIVPNFFPTLRVLEYNITGLDPLVTWASALEDASTDEEADSDWMEEELGSFDTYFEDWLIVSDSSAIDDLSDKEGADVETDVNIEKIEDKQLCDCDDDDDYDDASIGKKKKKHKKKKKPKNPDLKIPPPPSKSTPPGPAYSPQTLTLLGYTQYFANLTHINNDMTHNTVDDVDADRWREGKHKGKHPQQKTPHPNKFEFEVEYNTFDDSEGFALKDLTVKSYLRLAHRIGRYDAALINESSVDEEEEEEGQDELTTEPDRSNSVERKVSMILSIMGGHVHHYVSIIEEWRTSKPIISAEILVSAEEAISPEKTRKRNHRRQEHHRELDSNTAWFTFIKRAFVGTMDEAEIKDFQLAREQDLGQSHGKEL